MKITVIKGNVEITYSENEEGRSVPALVSSKDYHERMLKAVEKVTEQVIKLCEDDKEKDEKTGTSGT